MMELLDIIINYSWACLFGSRW